MKKPSRHMKNLMGRKKDFSINYQPLTLNRRGFSLVEVMVAAIILGVSLMAIYAVYIKTFEASGRAETKTVAASIAQRTMESAINKPFANLALMSTASPTPPTSFVVTNKDAGSTTVTETVVTVSSGTPSDYVTYQQTISEKGISYTVTTIVSWHDDDEDQLAPSDPDPNDYKRVHVTVTWPGATAPVTLDRFVSMYFRPNAHTTAGAKAAEFKLDDSNYVSLGSVNLETYTGGNKTSKAESLGLSSANLNSSGDLAGGEYFTDDDAGAEYPAEAHEDGTSSGASISSFSDSPISLKSNGSSTIKASAGAISNIISSAYSWHSGDNSGSGLWDDWPSPPDWSLYQNWKLPSSIAKSELNGGITWDYTPDPHPQTYKLFETGDAVSGTKSVITSETSNNKAVSRSWSKIYNVKIVKMNMQSVGKSIISIDSVEASVEGNADSSSSLNNTISWQLNNLKIIDSTTGNEVAGIPSIVDEKSDMPSVASWPAPIDTITVGEVTNNTDAGRAEARVVAITIKLKLDSNLLASQGNMVIPASTITLGDVQTNVTYTSM